MEKVFLRADGTYAVPIVGESHRQEALEEICGGQAARKKVVASLIREDENPHDTNAIRVEIDGKKVGYLSREMAKVYRGTMEAAGHADAVGTCNAVVEPPRSRNTPPTKLLDQYYVGDIYEVFLDLFDDASMDAILTELAKRAVQVPFDTVEHIQFAGARFCLTGIFNRSHDDLKAAIESRGGAVAENVSRKLRYLVVGGSGSTEWKYGTFGTKIEKAMLIREEDGAVLSVISEDQLATAIGELA
jgi:hypothetical protein